MPGVWHGIAGHRAQMASNVIVARTPQPCLASAARSGRRRGLRAGAKSDHSQTRAAVPGSWTRRLSALACKFSRQSLPEPWTICDRHDFQVPYIGRAKTTSVIDAITRRAKHEAGLPVLILKIPNNPILQSCALPDYNCGATLITTQDRAYTFCNLTKPAARCIAGLRFSANTAAAR
jgi:hypothetical protein